MGVYRTQPTVLGHRGAGKNGTGLLVPAGEVRENTAASCVVALSQGADGVEFDLQVSQDDVLVVFHNVRLRRPASSSLQVPRGARLSDYTARDLRDEFGIEELDDFLAPIYRHASEASLAADAAAPKIALNIELKNGYEQGVQERDYRLAGSFAAYLHDHPDLTRVFDVVVSAFDPQLLKSFVDATKAENHGEVQYALLASVFSWEPLHELRSNGIRRVASSARSLPSTRQALSSVITCAKEVGATAVNIDSHVLGLGGRGGGRLKSHLCKVYREGLDLMVWGLKPRTESAAAATIWRAAEEVRRELAGRGLDMSKRTAPVICANLVPETVEARDEARAFVRKSML